jgi:hypothetical protein
MADWRKRANSISGDVVFFEYVTSKAAKNSETVFIWDLDKTYLDTHFETLRGLWRAAMEKAFQKRNIPGTGSLVRALIHRKNETDQSKPFPIYFITASPPQIERRIRTKLEIDGIRPYGTFFKDNLRNLRPRYFNRLKRHVGYKLQALLELRMRLHPEVQQILWGDDSESDAVVYSLYSDICARRIGDEDLRFILDRLKVLRPQREQIIEIQSHIPINDPVSKIYINLAADTDPDYYSKFGRRMVATFTTFQIALDLYQSQHLNLEQLERVAQDMVVNYGVTPDQLGQSLEDLAKRHFLKAATAEEVIAPLQKKSMLPARFKLSSRMFIGSSRDHDPLIPDQVDYLNDFR